MQLAFRNGKLVHTVKFDPPITVKSGEHFTITYTLGGNMPNESNRRNLKALMDLLSDAHADITERACKINEHLLKADNPTKGNDEQGKRAFSNFDRKLADRTLGELLIDLDTQQHRCQRVYEEIEQIKKNLKII